jgi:hypothetical protein
VRLIACSEAAGAEPAGKQAAAGACGERPVVAAWLPAVGRSGVGFYRPAFSRQQGGGGGHRP